MSEVEFERFGIPRREWGDREEPATRVDIDLESELLAWADNLRVDNPLLRILEAVANHEKPFSMEDVARSQSISLGRANELVDALIQLQLVNRESERTYSISREGQAFLGEMRKLSLSKVCA